jgi:RNA polymerase sigma-70 factor (ECF subfamily)
MTKLMESRWTQATDEELVAAWRRDLCGADAATAVATLLGRYRRRVYAWCYGYVRNREAARDLAQDVLLTAHQKLGALRDGQRFGAWLFMVARNRCLASLRRRERWAGAQVDVDELPAAAPSPEQGLLDRLAVERLLSVLDGALDAQERQAIVLRCFERMPVDRITETLHLENATGARGVLQTARRKLRAELVRRGDAPATAPESGKVASAAG